MLEHRALGDDARHQRSSADEIGERRIQLLYASHRDVELTPTSALRERKRFADPIEPGGERQTEARRDRCVLFITRAHHPLEPAMIDYRDTVIVSYRSKDQALGGATS